MDIEAIRAEIVDEDDLHAEMAMIAENLIRAELDDAQRAKQTARLKEIYVELHPQTDHGGNKGNDGRFVPSGQLGHTASFTADMATKTGKSERAIRRDAERGEKIDEQVLDMVSGTRLATGAYLDQLKRVPIEKQATKVARDLKEPKAAKVKKGTARKSKSVFVQRMLRTIKLMNSTQRTELFAELRNRYGDELNP
jgi:hypothetical protein